MSEDPFIGEIVMFGGNFAPANWLFCDGQLLPISQNQSLFSILGTTFGGDGEVTFGLPDLRGRAPVHPGPGVPPMGSINLGQVGGRETVALSDSELPAHNHKVRAASAVATSGDPTGNVLAQVTDALLNTYGDPTNLVAMNPAAVADTGASQLHTNIQPFLAVSFIIAIVGIFPSMN